MSLLWAFILLAAAPPAPEGGVECRSTDPTAFDLNWSATDRNGLPRNPWWVAQDASGGAVDPSDRCSCGGFPVKTGVPFGDPKCTQTSSSDVPRGFHKFTCKLEWLRDFRNGVTRGHINWFPVVLTGYAWYETHSGPDDDVNFELAADTSAPKGGVPAQTKWNADAGELGRTDTLHVEMKKEETLDHLSEPWWKQLSAKADDKKVAREMVNGARAVVVGLFGLDAEHKGHSEAHPVYALALRTACARVAGRVTETWALLVRNYGNEGWCSRWDQWHRLDLNNSALFLQLPLDANSKKITLGPTSALFSNRKESSAALLTTSGPTADIQVAWQPVGASDVRVHGQLTFTWEPREANGAACVPPNRVPPIESEAEPDEGEVVLGDIVRRAGLGHPEAAEPPDTEPVKIMAATVAPIQRTGICPRNAQACSDELRARVSDAFFARVEAVEAGADSADRTLCEAARALLPAYTAQAAGKLIDSPEGRRLRRLESLVSVCEVQDSTAGSP